jgi:hypothetical protein
MTSPKKTTKGFQRGIGKGLKSTGKGLGKILGKSEAKGLNDSKISSTESNLSTEASMSDIDLMNADSGNDFDDSEASPGDVWDTAKARRSRELMWSMHAYDEAADSSDDEMPVSPTLAAIQKVREDAEAQASTKKKAAKKKKTGGDDYQRKNHSNATLETSTDGSEASKIPKKKKSKSVRLESSFNAIPPPDLNRTETVDRASLKKKKKAKRRSSGSTSSLADKKKSLIEQTEIGYGSEGGLASKKKALKLKKSKSKKKVQDDDATVGSKAKKSKKKKEEKSVRLKPYFNAIAPPELNCAERVDRTSLKKKKAKRRSSGGISADKKKSLSGQTEIGYSSDGGLAAKKKVLKLKKLNSMKKLHSDDGEKAKQKDSDDGSTQSRKGFKSEAPAANEDEEAKQRPSNPLSDVASYVKTLLGHNESVDSRELTELSGENEELRALLKREQRSADLRLVDKMTEIEELKQTIEFLKKEENVEDFSVNPRDGKSRQRLQGELLQAAARLSDCESITAREKREIAEMKQELTALREGNGVQQLKDEMMAMKKEKKELEIALEREREKTQAKVKSKDETIEFLIEELGNLKKAQSQAAGAVGSPKEECKEESFGGTLLGFFSPGVLSPTRAK